MGQFLTLPIISAYIQTKSDLENNKLFLILFIFLFLYMIVTLLIKVHVIPENY